MMKIRRAAERGHFDHGWLKTFHTFSFADYQDPKHMNFRALRVINEDWVAPGEGFGTHPHRDMEIITYVMEGALAHKDSMGTGSTIRPGELQRMSAGSGVTHSEFNHSPDQPVHLLQIWIMPDTKGIKPSYEQKTFPEAEKRDRLRLVASRDGSEGSLNIHQDARLYLSLLSPGKSLQHRLPEGKHAWIQVARGSIELNGEKLVAGDGAAISEERELRLTGIGGEGEILLFELT